jgi:hypothetical protein
MEQDREVSSSRKVISVGLLQVILAFVFVSVQAQATPMLGEVVGDHSNYSVIHNGSNPEGTGLSADWLWFDDNQLLMLDLDGGIVSLLGSQSFNLSSQNAANSLLEITDLDLDLNDGADGFLSGTMCYTLEAPPPVHSLLGKSIWACSIAPPLTAPIWKFLPGALMAGTILVSTSLLPGRLALQCLAP